MGDLQTTADRLATELAEARAQITAYKEAHGYNSKEFAKVMDQIAAKDAALQRMAQEALMGEPFPNENRIMSRDDFIKLARKTLSAPARETDK